MSLEDDLVKYWYPEERDALGVKRWIEEQADTEYHREFATVRIWGFEQYAWVCKIRGAEALIKSRINEALTSEARYLRRYATLILREKRKWDLFSEYLRTCQSAS